MWNLEGMRICGVYLGEHEVEGVVVLSRVAYGGRVVHTIVLDEPKNIYGNLRERVILEHENVLQVKDNNG
jgi:hypothetical protein